MNEHGVAEGKEAISLLYGRTVGVQDLFPSRQRGNEHDQRALRQMKIRHERVDAFEAIVGIDKDVRPARRRLQRAVFEGEAFERAAGGRSDGYDASAVFLRFRNDTGGLLRDDAELGVNFMILDLILFDRPERA